MHQIIRAFKAGPDVPRAYALVTCLIPEVDPVNPFVPVLRIVLYEGCGAAVDPGTMETVRVALGKALGLVFFDRRPIGPIAGSLGETMGIRDKRRREVPESERRSEASASLVDHLEPADIIRALRSLSPRDPAEDTALQQHFHLPQAA